MATRLRFLVYIMSGEALGVTLPVEVMDELGLTDEEKAVVEKYVPNARAVLLPYKLKAEKEERAAQPDYRSREDGGPALHGAWVSEID